MFNYHQTDPYFLSSLCPSSCALVAFALRLGGTIDPEFLLQCQIMDPKIQKSLDALKPIPLKFETPSSYFGHQQDMFLDMGASNTEQFYDPWEFKQFNSWVGSSDHWNSIYDVDNDIVIDLL